MRIRTAVWTLCCVSLLFIPSPLSSQEIRVTLLGTGTPSPRMDRFGPSTLVEAGDKTYLFDAGRGAIQRLEQIGVSYRELDGIFLTHLHSDHVVGLPDLWLTGWLMSARSTPLRVFGPEGTRALVEHLTQAFEYDTGIRISDDGRSPEGAELEVIELTDGYEWEEDGVTIRAFLVDHRPIEPAFGFRVDYEGNSVALSGDTRYSESLIRNATGVDVLIHEVADAPTEFLVANPDHVVLAHHTLTPDVGRVFTQVGPKLAVYSHYVLFSGFSLEDLITRTRTTYGGPLVLGEDLMTFDIGAQVTVWSR